MAGSVKRLVRDLRRVEPANLSVLPALRCAVGVLIPLLVGTAVGRPGEGVTATIGALMVGFASYQGVYGTRFAAMAVTAAGAAISTFVGATAGAYAWLVVPLTGVWAFAAGLMASIGPAATVVGLQWTIALVAFTNYPMSPLNALGQASLVLAGGLLQIVFVVGVWPLRTNRPEREALAGVYRVLAEYAEGVPRDESPLPDADTFDGAVWTLIDTNPWGRERSRLRLYALLDEAERIRIELVAVAPTRRVLAADGQEEQVARIDGLLAAAARTCRSIAAALVSPQPRRWAAVAAPAVLETAGGPPEGELPPDAADRVGILRGHLREAARLAAGPEKGGAGDRPGESGGRYAQRPVLPVHDTLLTLRANLNVRSEMFRHAVRLAVVLVVASLLYRVLPIERGYWVGLTALLVLRTDYGTTMVRGIARILGTAVGVVLATLIAAELRPGPYALVVLVAVFAFAALVVFRANYTLFAVFVTGYIVFLLAVNGLPSGDTSVERLIDTAIGGVLALIAYAVWPTWEGASTAGKLAALLDAQARYGRAVLSAYAEPCPRDADALHSALVRARLARSNAQASVERMLGEPGKGRYQPERAIGFVGATRRYAQAVLTLHAHVLQCDDLPLPEVCPFAERLEKVLGGLAGALRAGRAGAVVPALGDAHATLRQALGDATVTRRAIVYETGQMAEAVRTMRRLLATRDP
ncbi:hypothetical protein Misp01_45810 [Microtetraspora sp. NBRC 13810]|uniref:FUSC family protein n=1 Tax=Microtetraspora sp. NBRC 13810 TaxID=3030990 RepID=UPI0024A19EF2|nr:FUSC family protein [Microtetraspora sp. NBRC 13810]GLW09452.1 hypothetical protein Misp01_45810 [Microtetraspora sp. NBRC 13810]